MYLGRGRIAAIAAAILTVFMLNTAVAQELVLATWGGSWGKGIQEEVIDPFTKETGISVKVISGASLANLKMISAQRHNPQVDVITMVSQDAAQAYDDGLLAPVLPTEVSNIKTSTDLAVQRDANGQAMYAGIWMYPYGIAYRTDKIDWDLVAWKDLWDPKLKGKVAVSSPKYMSSYFLLMINKIAGGSEQNVTLGLDKVATLGKNLTAVADDSATQQRLLAQGEAWAVPMISGAAYKAIEQGVPARFVIPAEGAPAGVDAVALVKGGPNAEAARKFVNFWLEAKTASAAAAAVGVLPLPRKDGAGGAASQSKYALSKEEESRLLTFDARTVNANKADWIGRWEREISPVVGQ